MSGGDEALRARAWVIAERLAAASAGEARLITLPEGYRIELHFAARAPDEMGVVAALALGDRWGHHYSSPERNGGVAKESVWSEVYPPSPPGQHEAPVRHGRTGAPREADQLAVDAEPEEEPEPLFAVEAAEEPEAPAEDEDEEEEEEEDEDDADADDEPTELLELERLSVR